MTTIEMMSKLSSDDNNSSQCMIAKTGDYEQQRQKFLNSMYSNNNPSNPDNNPSSSMISISYTENCASPSFENDCKSPLDIKHTDSASASPPIYFSLDDNDTESKVSQLTLEAHRSNITQKANIVPPTKMKKVATARELQMVLDHFKIAQHKDIEEILSQNEEHVLYYRDKLYAEAQQSGITENSSDVLRLKILAAVVEYTFMNIEPPNEYTKQTDRKHFKEVGAWTAKFAKDKGVIPSLVLIYAAWCHDIERFIPSTKCEYLPESVDKYRKQIIHGVTSAKVACCLLKGAPVSQEEKRRIFEIILHHDIPNPREDIVILNETLVRGISEDLFEELALLMDADSFAFFQSTIYYFILFKSKKNSPDWIWERVKLNLKRLRPYLRDKASQAVHKLPIDVRNKMAINYQELAEFCAEIPTELDIAPKKEEIKENIDFLSADNVQITECKETPRMDSDDSQKSEEL